jgi:hypothetical protein
LQLIQLILNLQFTVACSLRFFVFTSRVLATDLNTETSTSSHYEVFLPFLVQSPWNLGTQLKPLVYSIIALSLRTRSVLVLVLSTAELSWLLNFLLLYALCTYLTENTVCIVDDVTALHSTARHAEMCLSSRCLETDCITWLLYCCVCVLLSDGCFCDLTVLAWDKYATIRIFTLWFRKIS